MSGTEHKTPEKVVSDKIWLIILTTTNWVHIVKCGQLLHKYLNVSETWAWLVAEMTVTWSALDKPPVTYTTLSNYLYYNEYFLPVAHLS